MTLLTKKEIADYVAIVDKIPEAERNKVFSLLEMDRIERCKDVACVYLRETSSDHGRSL